MYMQQASSIKINNKCEKKNDFIGKNFSIIIGNNKNKPFCCRTCISNENKCEKKNKNNEKKIKVSKVNILCKKCNTINNHSNKKCKSCSSIFYKTYCSKCDKYRNFDMFHCNHRNVCLKGKKEDYKYCNNCKEWLRNDIYENHKCLDTSNDNCAICCEKLCIKPRVKLNCGHVLHKECYLKLLKNIKSNSTNELVLNKLRCPICKATLCTANNKDKEAIKNLYYKINETKIKNPIVMYLNKNNKRLRTIRCLCNDCSNNFECEPGFLNRCKCGSFNTQKI